MHIFHINHHLRPQHACEWIVAESIQMLWQYWPKRLQTTFNIKIKGETSSWFKACESCLCCFLSVHSVATSIAFECCNDKMFNVGQCVHAMLVFILSVKILFYCMQCASIKVRFRTLIKYLKDSKSSRVTIVAKAMALHIMFWQKASGSCHNLRKITDLWWGVRCWMSHHESCSALLSFICAVAFGVELRKWNMWKMLRQKARNRCIRTFIALISTIEQIARKRFSLL